MNDKNGFVFVETIVVLTVTMVILLTLYNSYVVILKNIQSRQYFNNMNDIYKAHIVKKMFKNEKGNPNYSLTSNEITVYAPKGIYDSSKGEKNCYDEVLSSRKGYDFPMKKDCSEVLTSLGISYVVLLPNNFNTIDFRSHPSAQKTNGFYKMSFQKFVGTLDEYGKGKTPIGHIVIVMIDSKTKKYSYASIQA